MNRHDENSIHKFYSTALGELSAELLREQIDEQLESGRNLRVLGCGYTTPFVSNVTPMCERLIHAKTENLKPLAYEDLMDPKGLRYGMEVLTESGTLPFARNAFDRIIAAHFLERSPHLTSDLYEMHRVLQPEGQLVLIVPNRLGIWARTEQTPFIDGLPFTKSQIRQVIEDCGFQVESCKSALFFAPKNWRFNLKICRLVENTMKWLGHWFGKPPVGGVLIVSARKRVIAPPRPRGLAMRFRQMWDLSPQPAPTSSVKKAKEPEPNHALKKTSR